MNSNIFLFLGFLFFCCPYSWAQSEQESTSQQTRPNVVFVLIDDIGSGWLPPYAKELEPEDIEQEIMVAYNKAQGRGTADAQKHIDAAKNSMPYLSTLAEEGAVFNRCFTTSALCSPSRAGIITGKYQNRWGSYFLRDVIEGGIPSNEISLPSVFQENGYATGLIGKWHVSKNDPSLKGKVDLEHLRSSSMPGKGPLDMGFDYYYGYNFSHSTYYNSKNLWEGNEMVPILPEGKFLTEVFNNKAVEFVESSLKKEKSFFLFYAPMTLHGAFDDSPEKYSSQFDTGVEFSNSYAGHLLALDEGIKDIYATLEKYDAAKETIFILCSDNGSPIPVPPYNAPFKGGKGTGWLGGSYVPLIIYMPGKILPQRNGSLVSAMDILPTAMDFAGIPIPQDIDGVSLKPILTGKDQTEPHPLLFSSGGHSSRFSYSYYLGESKKTMDSKESPMYVWGINNEYFSLFLTEVKPDLYATLPQGKPAEHLFYNIQKDPLTKKQDLSKPAEMESITEGIKQWMKNNSPPSSHSKEQYQDLLKQLEEE